MVLLPAESRLEVESRGQSRQEAIFVDGGLRRKQEVMDSLCESKI